MLHRILDGARKDLLRDVRRQLGELRVSLVRAEAPEDEQKALGRSITQLDELFLLVVVGEFNAGKSAVINALLGEQVLEEGVTPTTSRIELLKHGEERTRTPAGGGYEEITLPVGILREMSVVDTPGTNAVLRGHEALTRDFVPRSDLVLFVTSADRPFTESERAFLEAIRDWGKKVVVAVNKTDILDKPADVDKVVEFVRDQLRERLGLRPEVFAVSARRAQKAKAAGVPPDPRTTGFGALEAYLTRTLDEAERLRLKLLSPVGVALRVLDGVAATAKERLSVVEADEAVLREIDSQLVLHLQEQSRDFRLRVAEVEKPLVELEKRGASFLERTLRVPGIPALLDREGIAGDFRQEVFAGLATAVDKRVEGVVDAVVTGEARLWPAVVERLKRRRAVHGERMPGPDAKVPPVNHGPAARGAPARVPPRPRRLRRGGGGPAAGRSRAVGRRGHAAAPGRRRGPGRGLGRTRGNRRFRPGRRPGRGRARGRGAAAAPRPPATGEAAARRGSGRPAPGTHHRAAGRVRARAPGGPEAGEGRGRAVRRLRADGGRAAARALGRGRGPPAGLLGPAGPDRSAALKRPPLRAPRSSPPGT